jgi:ArsR family transcriptional regulator
MTTVPQEMPVRVKGCCEPVASPLDGARVAELAALFRAVADPTRVQMLHMLVEASGPVCVCDLTAAFDLGQPTVSHHLGKLRDAGLVSSSRRGIWAFYELRSDLSAAARAVLASISGAA